MDVASGVVQGITWDDACVFCGRRQCDEITYDFNGNPGTQADYAQPTRGCYITEQECNRLHFEEGRTDCDLTLYVVWTGSDSSGNSFLSAANRFSKFPVQELQNRLSQSIPDIDLTSNPFN